MKGKWGRTYTIWLTVFCMAVSMFQPAITVQAENTDSEEMNRTMPVLKGKKALAYVDFDSANGVSSGKDWTYGYDLTDAGEGNDSLTLEEVKTLSTTYSIVFRAKLDIVTTRDRAILSFSPDDLTKTDWKNALSVGIVGANYTSQSGYEDDQRKYMYYEIRQTTVDEEGEETTNELITGGNAYQVTRAADTSGDGEWHTIALVQTGTGFNYYVDGKLLDFVPTVALSGTIGALYTDATTFSARIGRFHYANGGLVKGSFDWFAFYGSALSKQQVLELSNPYDYKAARYDNVQSYRASGGYTYPEKKGYVFAGWYKDEACTEVLNEEAANSAASAWAKFVPEEVLGTKAQISNEYTNTTTQAKCRSIRFVTSVDSLQYAEVGFDISYTLNGRGINVRGASDQVYTKLYAIGAGSGTPLKYTPQDAFCEASGYFKAWTIHNIPGTDYGVEIVATPYWITEDGTTVTGAWAEKTIQMGLLAAELKSSDTLVSSNYNAIMSDIKQPFDSFDTTNWNYTPQGGYTDGKYYYQAFLQSPKEAEKDECLEANNKVCIAKYDMTGVLLQKVFIEEPSLNHANDITYNSRLGCFVICHAKPNRTSISYLDPVTLEVTDTFTIDYEIFSIDYNAAKDEYVVGIAYGQTFRILNSDFYAVSPAFTPTSKTNGYITQGVTCDENFVYFVLFKQNVIVVYDWQGSFVTLIDLESQIPSTGLFTETENISVVGNKIYVGCGKYKLLASNTFYVYELSGFVAK